MKTLKKKKYIKYEYNNITNDNYDTNTFKSNDHAQKEDLVKSKKKLSSILFIKSDENRKFYEFQNKEWKA